MISIQQAKKRNEVQYMIYFKNIMLCEKKPHTKERYYMIPAIRNVEKIKSTTTESKLMFVEDWK